MEELQEEESGSELEGNESPPEPLWKTRGYTSLEAFVADMDGKVETERARASVAEQALTVKPAVQPPQFNREKYDDNPEVYSQEFNQEVSAYLASSNAPQFPASVIDAAVENMMVEGEKREINRHVLYGVMRSLIVADPNRKHMLNTPDGVRELGKLALSQFSEKAKEDAEKETPAEHDQPKGGSPSAQSKKGKSKESEVESLTKQIDEAGAAGKVDDVVKLVLQRNAAKLKLAKKGK